MRLRQRWRTRACATAAAVLAAGLLAAPAAGATQSSHQAEPAPSTAPDRVASPDKDLVKGWNTSADRALTLASDVDGVHVMSADSDQAYQWHAVTTLSEPGFATALWVGNYCLADRSHAVVVYAPSEFVNTEELMDRGAFTAIVDLDTGVVKKLAVNASLAYFDPSCDTTTHTATITQFKDGQTRLLTVDAAGKTVSTSTVKGEITSATPAGGRLVGASGNRVVSIGRGGALSTLAVASGTPYGIHPDAGGGIDFLDQTKTAQHVKRVTGKKTTTLATGGIGDFGLSTGAGGKVFLVGASTHTSSTHTAALPAAVERLTANPQADVSTDGGLAVDQAVSPALRTHAADPVPGAGDPGSVGGPVRIQATVTGTGRKLAFSAAPGPAGGSSGAGTTVSPSLADPSAAKAAPGTGGGTKPSTTGKAPLTAAASGGAHSTVDDDRYCSVARNDPNTQAYQPTPNQVEWAVDMAVRGDLTSGWLQQSGWRSSEGLGTVNPQALFPLPALNGGGQIPSQILLGVLTQESNLWQATSHAAPGELGDPLVGNFYGTNIYPGTAGYDPNAVWQVDWDVSDCGYGIGQVTDGMRMAGHTKPGETALPAAQQRALALDYTVNIAYAARILAQKWNELHSSTVSLGINNDDPSKIENWFAATWDYNEGFNAPGSNASGYWGLGWYNNPANPIYPADRHPFLDGNTYSDAAKPQDWPYEEKVLGWAAWPIDTGRSYDDSGNEQQKGDSGFDSAGYAAAWWTTDAERSQIKPPLSTFCDTSNGCDVSDPPTCETQHSGDASCDTSHWWNGSASWKTDCDADCGHASIRYVTLRTEPGNADPAPGPCNASALPSGSVVVDDVPSGTSEARCPGSAFTTQGDFSFTFPADSSGHYEAREDLQQIGGGFDGHYWFSHGREPDNWANLLETTGAWTPSSLPHQLYKVQAFMPDLGNMTKTAVYQVTTADGTVYTRTVDQSSKSNGWVTIGYFDLGSNAQVALNNITDDGSSGDTTVAYDAVAFTPIAGTWEHHTFDAVSIFPSDINLDTSTPYLVKSPMRTRQTLYDWAHSRTAGGEKYDNSGTLTGLTNYPTCSGGTDTSSCVGASLASAVNTWEGQVTAAGVDPGNSPSEADWMGFSNATPPATIDPDDSFSDDDSYKIKTHVDASYAMGPDGKIIAGSTQVTDTPRTGDTQIAPFARNFIRATVTDYGALGVSLPDLSYSGPDLNVYNSPRNVANPLTSGYTPGQAYVPRTVDASVDSAGTCLDTKVVSGGSLGYRPLDAQPSTDQNMTAWLDSLRSLAQNGKIPQEVADTAGDIYSLFFEKADLADGHLAGSLFNMAPPIWQDVSMGFCAGGTVKPTHATDDIDDTPSQGLVYQSYMPDMYLYLDGHLVNESGNPATGPVQRGDFSAFSDIPGVTSDPGGSAYGLCAVDLDGNAGNPWDIQATPEDFPVIRPKEAEFCDGT